jgi:hypothetical protein
MSSDPRKNRYRKRNPLRHRRDSNARGHTRKKVEREPKTFIDIKNDIETKSEEQLIEERINGLKSSLFNLNNNLEQPIRGIDELGLKILGLEGRIIDLRKMNYKNLIYLEKKQLELGKKWNSEHSFLKISAEEKTSEIRISLSNLQRELNQMRARTTNQNHSRIELYESRYNNIRNNHSIMGDQISQQLTPFREKYNDVNKDLSIAEKTIDLLIHPSFSWKQSEHPLISVKAEDMGKNIDGILTLTNHRFLFESEKEIVLKKVLFIATEKKTTRQLKVNQPIGVIEKIEKGRVSFLKGTGLFIRFKPESNIKEMKIDTTNEDAENILRFFNWIVSGKADLELNEGKEDNDRTDSLENQEILCSFCSAPYRNEVYRGQTTVQCNYCGTMIRI